MFNLSGAPETMGRAAEDRFRDGAGGQTHRPFWTADHFASFPDRVAIVDAETGFETTYDVLSALADAFAGRLSAGRGILLLDCDNSVSSIAAYLGALRARCPVLLKDRKANRPMANDAWVPVLYYYDPDCDLLQVRDVHRGLELHPDLALLLSTSGSTGSNRLVRLSDANLESNANAIATYLGLSPRDRAPTVLPMAYSYGMSVVNSHLAAGASLMTTALPLVSETMWDAFDRHECTGFNGVPHSFELLQRAGLLDRLGARVRYVTQAGGRMPPDAVRALAERGRAFGWDLFVMYGQTEASPRMAFLPPALALHRPDSIGRAIPGGEILLRDAAGQEVTKPDEEGEIVFRGPNVMMGYANRPEDLVLGPGQSELLTGDLARRDGNGLLYISGRKARFVKLSGRRVGLDEVGDWLAMRGIDGVAVGRDDALGLVCATGGKVSEEGVAAELADELGVPSSMVHEIQVDVLPYLPNGKPDLRAALAEMDAVKPVDAASAPSLSDPPLDRLALLLALFRRQFPGRDIVPTMNLQRIGGSSIDYIDLELAMERDGLVLPRNWQSYSIQDLAELGAVPARPASKFDAMTARVLCTLLVVLVHVVGFSPDSGLRLSDGTLLRRFNEAAEFLRMPMFAFLAGMTFQVMGSERLPLRDFGRNMLATLIVPTLFAMVCFAIASTLVGSRFALHGALEVVDLLYMPYAHFWFVMALCVILWTIYAVLDRFRRARLFALATLVIVFQAAGYRIWTPVLALNNVAHLLPFAAMGYLASARLDDLLRLRRSLMLGAVILAGTLAVGHFAWPGLWADGIVRWNLGFLLSLCLIWLCLCLAHPFRWLRPLAPYTFMIYLWYPFGTSTARRALQAFGVESIPVHLLAGVAAGVLVPILVARMLARIPDGSWLMGRETAGATGV